MKEHIICGILGIVSCFFYVQMARYGYLGGAKEIRQYFIDRFNGGLAYQIIDDDYEPFPEEVQRRVKITDALLEDYTAMLNDITSEENLKEKFEEIHRRVQAIEEWMFTPLDFPELASAYANAVKQLLADLTVGTAKTIGNLSAGQASRFMRVFEHATLRTSELVIRLVTITQNLHTGATELGERKPIEDMVVEVDHGQVEPINCDDPRIWEYDPFKLRVRTSDSQGYISLPEYLMRGRGVDQAINIAITWQQHSHNSLRTLLDPDGELIIHPSDSGLLFHQSYHAPGINHNPNINGSGDLSGVGSFLNPPGLGYRSVVLGCHAAFMT